MTIFCKAVIARIVSRLPGCLFLCLAGLGATGFAQVTRIGQGAITTVAGIQGQGGDSASAVPTQAIQANIGNPAAMVTDASGNIYFTDASASSTVWFLYLAGNPPPLLTNLYQPPFHTGYAYAIAGTIDQACSGGGTCGDNGLATQAVLSGPTGLALDTSGNLYIADPGDNAIRKVTASDGVMSTIAGDPNHTMYGYSGENVPALGTYLYGPTSVAFDTAGDLYVADANNAIIRKIDTNGSISTVAGTVPSNGNPVFCATAPCGDGQAATSAQLGYVYNVFVDTATGNIYVTDNGSSAIRKIDAQSGTIDTVAGTLLQTCVPGTPPTCGDGHAATMAMLNYPSGSYLDSQGNLYIADTGDNGVRVVDTSGNIHTVVGQLSATGAYEGGTPGTAANAMLNGPFSIAFGLNGVLYVADQYNNILRQVVPPAALATQIITFNPPASATYGESPISLSATSTTTAGASTGLSVTYSVVTGPGTISGSRLTITGAGTIVVQASQAGNSTYGPATPVDANIVVAPVTLTVTAPQNLALKSGNPIPTLSYTITGFVNNDQPTVVTGSPLIQVTDPTTGMVLPAGSIPAPGSYPITIGVGTLADPNYLFSFTDGMLIVSQGLVQTLTFSSYTPPTIYGGANSTFTFSVTSNAGLTATVTPSGPVQLQGPSGGIWSATVTGTGRVSFTATQTGNFNYARATATSQFVVGPAVLTVPLANATRAFGAPNPTFSYGTPTGFLGADNSAVLGGLPSYSTTATATSDPGTYPLTATQGTLFAQNYSFVFIPATLTITQATQHIDNFTAPANVTYGGSGYTLQALASSNLPLVYSATGAGQIASDGVTFQPTGVGPATITATQAGNLDYAPVSATVSFNVAQITQYVSAVAVSVPFDAAIPQLNWCFASVDATTKLAACDSSISLPANLYSGAPAVTTTATEGSTPGPYPITVSAGTLTSSVYSFVFVPGLLTINPAATYTLSANPSSIVLSRGQSGQSTVTLTPIHNYVGTVTIACSGLPAGVTCKVDPAGLTTSLNSQGVASPVSAMLTISVGQVVGQNTMGGSSRLLAAGMLGLPGLFAGILIFYRRTQFNQRSIFTGILLLVALGASTTFVTACGGGSSNSGGAQPGTTQIMITGSGAASAGSVSQSVGLTVTIQ